jgi:hypothetical protein
MKFVSLEYLAVRTKPSLIRTCCPSLKSDGWTIRQLDIAAASLGAFTTPYLVLVSIQMTTDSIWRWKTYVPPERGGGTLRSYPLFSKCAGEGSLYGDGGALNCADVGAGGRIPDLGVKWPGSGIRL